MRKRMVRRGGGLLVAVLVLALSVGTATTALAQELSGSRQAGLALDSADAPVEIISVETDENGTSVVVDLSSTLEDDVSACGEGGAVAMMDTLGSVSRFAVVGVLDPFLSPTPTPIGQCQQPDPFKVNVRVEFRVRGETFNVESVLHRDPPVGITKLSNLKQTDGKPAQGFLATAVLDKDSKATVTIEGDAETNFNGQAGSTKVRIKYSIDASDPTNLKLTQQFLDLKK